MGRTTFFPAAAAALALAGAVHAQDRLPSAALEKAGWTLVTASEDVYVYMRVAEKAESGLRRVWTAYDSAGPRDRDGFTFRSVKSLGEYDCKRNVSRVVDETYHDAPALTGKTWHSPKFIPTPWAKPEPGSVGALRMAFACRALHDT
ncbi:MAG TPA: surface-adhesin E family protein [Phenylobacterium sp.]|jgi:hypothetical protein